MAFKLTPVEKEPLFEIELLDASTKQFKLWDLIEAINNGLRSDDPLIGPRNALRSATGIADLSTSQAAELQVAVTDRWKELDSVKKLSLGGSAK